MSLGYLLVLVALLVPVGRWSDRAGRKLIYLYGFVVFTAASAACGFASSLPMLVGLRLVQAVGAAMLQANSVALVATSVPPARRRAALGIQAGAQAIGLGAGSDDRRSAGRVGRLAVDLLDQRAGRCRRGRRRAGSCCRVPASAPPRGSLDGGGLALLAVASTALLLALSSAAGLPIGGVAIVAWLAVAAWPRSAGLVWWERRAAHAAAGPGGAVRAGGRGRAGRCAAGVSGAVRASRPVPAGVPAAARVLAAGLMLTALPAGFGLCGGRRRPGAAGGVVGPAPVHRRCAAGRRGRRRTDAARSSLPVRRGAAGACSASGLGVYIPANNAAIMAAIPNRMAATAGGMLNMARGLGTAVGVAAVTIALHVAEAAPAAPTLGSRRGWVC